MPRHTRSLGRRRMGSVAAVLLLGLVLTTWTRPAEEAPRAVSGPVAVSAFSTEVGAGMTAAIAEHRRDELRADSEKQPTAAAKRAKDEKAKRDRETTQAAENATEIAAGNTSSAGTPASTGSAHPGAEGAVIDLVNRERSSAGCGPVRDDAGLAKVARAHSADMASRQFFDHVNPDGLGPFDRAKGAGVQARAENIAAGQATPAAVMRAWMDSPGHRANILNCDLHRLGVGRATATAGPYSIYWTQLFG